MFKALPGQHDWQQFTETCVACGFNAWDKKFPTICPGNYKLYNEVEAKRAAKRKAKQDRDYPDNDTGW